MYASATAMIRDTRGIIFPTKSVRIALPIDPFMVEPNDGCDLGVLIDMGEDALADRRVFLHLTSFF